MNGFISVTTSFEVVIDLLPRSPSRGYFQPWPFLRTYIIRTLRICLVPCWSFGPHLDTFAIVFFLPEPFPSRWSLSANVVASSLSSSHSWCRGRTAREAYNKKKGSYYFLVMAWVGTVKVQSYFALYLSRLNDICLYCYYSTLPLDSRIQGLSTGCPPNQARQLADPVLEVTVNVLCCSFT